MKTRRSLTLEYALLQMGFWCCSIAEVNFAGVYLLERGYTNAELGVILALGNAAAFLLGPVLSSFLDRYKNLSATRIGALMMGFRLLLLACRPLFTGKPFLLSGTYVLSVALLVSAYSMALKVYADYGHSASPIRYGLTRAVASVSMGVLSLGLGTLVTEVGTELLTCIAMGFTLLQMAAYLLLGRRVKGIDPAGREKEEAALSLPRFVVRNGGYSLMLLGVILMFIAHNIFFSFSLTVVEGVGGDNRAMGVVNALAVFLEIPVMLFYDRLAKGRRTRTFMLVSFVFFFVKNLCFALAGSVTGICFALLFQIPSFALYSVASVEFADEVIPRSDASKAQSLAFSVSPIGSVAACFLGGLLFDSLGSRVTMFIAAAVSLLGMAIAIPGAIRAGMKKRAE